MSTFTIDPTNSICDAVVIGAGQAGLAAGYHLQRAGLRFAIVDAAPQAGGSWPAYYESLRLFSPARFSSLPGLAFPGDPDRYPSRDETTQYLRAYAAHFRLPVVGNTRVDSVSRAGDVFTVRSTDGRGFKARNVIAASGAFHCPALPQLPGQDIFQGTVLHSFAYQSPEAFAGQRVVVMGAANSAVQIGVELARTARVTLARRRPPNLLRQRLWGRDVHFWWWLLGLDTSTPRSLRGRIFKRLSTGPGPAVLDAGAYGAELDAGRPSQKPVFTHFTRSGVVWPDGTHEPVDSVIFATGYAHNFNYLQSLGALDQKGRAMQHEGVSTRVKGLYFVGLSYQRTFASATLRGVGPDAALVVGQLLTA